MGEWWECNINENIKMNAWSYKGKTESKTVIYYKKLELH